MGNLSGVFSECFRFPDKNNPVHFLPATVFMKSESQHLNTVSTKKRNKKNKPESPTVLWQLPTKTPCEVINYLFKALVAVTLLVVAKHNSN